MIGRKLGNRYEILALIGGGGMSLVYQARDTYLNRIVAVKVLREQFTSDDDFVRRFRREAQAVASLSHLNIVSIYDVGRDDNVHYLVMEFIKGKTLKEVIQERGLLSLEEAVDIAKQICDGLEHAHENAIVHRDVKPHNIIITRGGKVKVTDFGIARAASTATVTHTRGIIGSVHYFSPEQAKGEITGDKSDIYSLGIVLYEMVTGKMPFEGESPISIALKHIQSEPTPPTIFNPEIPDTLEKIILKAISKNPKDRYETIGSMRLDLMSVLFDKVISTSKQYTGIAPPKTAEKKVSENTLVFTEDISQGESNTPQDFKQSGKRKIKPRGLFLLALIILAIILGALWGAGEIFIKEEVIVPDIVNLPAPEAQRILASNNLKMEVLNEAYNSEIPEGQIISQDPDPESRTKAGRVVEVIVSLGPALVEVPNVIDISQIMADVYISNANLKVGKVDQDFSAEHSQGTVISQAPEAGEMVRAKSEVDLVISKGPKPQYIPMPTLIGLDLSKAEGKLLEVRLSIGNIIREKSEAYPENFIIRQTPAPGKDILQGSSVDLFISDGPGPSTQQAEVKINLFESGEVKIVVNDNQGKREAYKAYHEKGDFLTKQVSYYGKGTITVYVDDKKIRQQAVPEEQ